MNITPKQFKKLSDIVYRESGIYLKDEKLQLLTARLSKRLRLTGIRSVREYIDCIDEDPQELVLFIDAISTNHTFFFRESHHFKYIKNTHQKIWSAASSSGEEPYSIAIHCLENGFRPSVYATDIATEILQQGQRGIFPINRTKDLSLDILKKYFKKGVGRWDGYIKIRDEIRNMVIFDRYNLVTDAILPEEFDIIFCRNVLIYFDNITKANVVNKLFHSLKWKGYLIVGGAESLNSIDHQYKYIAPNVYCKQR